MDEINALSNLDGVETRKIGHSVHGRPIHAFHVGSNDGDQIIVMGAIHAREWITTFLIIELVKIYAMENLGGGVWFIPLVNPDGVHIALNAAPLWKANARGVDLNVNFDADWGGGTQNVRVVSSENYIGPHPNSEPEVRALIEFTKKINPRTTIAYHSKGEVIYHGFQSKDGRIPQELIDEVERIAILVGGVTGYEPIKTVNSTGGYSDWVMMHMGVPALTIEVGNDDFDHPIGVDKLPEILAQNKDIPGMILSQIKWGAKDMDCFVL